MTSFRTIQLLGRIASVAQHEKESFSKLEIVKKINEIKYLSSQKKVPKLTLRKEIIHLESQLKGVMELERKLLLEKNKESTKVIALKRQMEMIRNKLHADEGDMDKKVERLSHLLGEHLARKEVSREVTFAEGVNALPTEKKKDPETAAKVMKLQRHLELLKSELGLHKELETKNPEELRALEDKIAVIEEKLQRYKQFLPEEKPIEVKHKLLFGHSAEVKDEEADTESQLPLPPPPRME